MKPGLFQKSVCERAGEIPPTINSYKETAMGYKFIDETGKFTVDKPEMSSYLYFPLCNDEGIKSAITPELAGDMKVDQNTFALQPVSSEELHNSRATRNFWVKINGKDLWSLTGQSAKQQMLKGTADKETTSLEAGFLYHKLTRASKDLPLKAEITSFVPSNNDPLELTAFKLVNTGDTTMTVEGTSAIPLYGRSADNYRDHRQVTSLLGRSGLNESGLWLKPALSFDERGHQINETTYGVFGRGQTNSGNAVTMIGAIPTVEEFIGEGGSLDWPLSLNNREEVMVPIGTKVDGFEAMAGLCFEKASLKPGESITFYIGIFIDKNDETDKTMAHWVRKYGSETGFNDALEATKAHWQKKVDVIGIRTKDENFDHWMRWVNLQPILRRIYGCSFLPHHDYGRGGRGWRDLWQDCLALLLMEPGDVRFLLLNNFAGVRIDGSNATIIGSEPGEFIADRNNISRIWMDHGAWPWLTTKEYIHQSGDLGFLLEEQTYFKDALTARAKGRDLHWENSYGQQLKTDDDQVYKGSLIEHLLIQNLSIVYHVGQHNILKLEDADWNDALDMAGDLGESVAFTALYAGNLRDLSLMLKDLAEKKSISHIPLCKELVMLLEDVDWMDVEGKNAHLARYFDSVAHKISGEKVSVPIVEICKSIDKKAVAMTEHLQRQEFIASEEGYRWFNSYYDNHGKAVEGDHNPGIRVMLTGQVFTLMGNIATDEQAASVVKTCKHYLQDAGVGGYRLNTDFKEIKHDLGRCFGFSYGHKENGAMFSHMAIMYGNALYKRGFLEEGFGLIKNIFSHCSDFEKARIYPSIPEYVNNRGRGMYTYLTGSASWLLYTVVTEMFGCQCYYGDLKLEPKLHPGQFKDGVATINFLYGKKPLTVQYHLDGKETAKQTFKGYQLLSASSDAVDMDVDNFGSHVILPSVAVRKAQEAGVPLHVTVKAIVD